MALHLVLHRLPDEGGNPLPENEPVEGERVVRLRDEREAPRVREGEF